MKIQTAILLFLLFFAYRDLYAQGGGPPMLTTDPGTPGDNHWEINATLGYHFLNALNIQIPTTEIVYGIGSRFQISTQLPLPNIDFGNSHFATFTQPQTGVKYRIFDEEKNFISLSVYPQISIPLKKEQRIQLSFPIELEKTFGNFRIGEEIGYLITNGQNLVFSGTIVGYRFKNELEIMGELFLSKTPYEPQLTEGLVNFGVRKQLNKHLILLSSFGTEVITVQNEDKDLLFGLFGVQILLGKD